MRGSWELAAEGKTLALVVEGKLEKLEAKLAGEKATVSVKDDAVLVIAPAKLFEKGEGSIRLTGQITGETIAGAGEAPGTANVRWNARRTAAFTPVKKPDEKPSPLDKPLDFPETYPAGAFGRSSPPPQPASVLIQGRHDLDIGAAGHSAKRRSAGDGREDFRGRPGPETSRRCASDRRQGDARSRPGSSIAIRTPRSAGA